MAAKEKSQSEKFIEKAKELGVENDDGEAMERAFGKITTPPTKKKPDKQ